jgi:hypothetical protein
MNFAIGWYLPEGNNQEIDMRFEVCRESNIATNGK